MYTGYLMLSMAFETGALTLAAASAVISYEYWTTTSVELGHLRPGGMSALAIWLYRIGNIALNSLNAFWFYKMLSGALKVLGGDACGLRRGELRLLACMWMSCVLMTMCSHRWQPQQDSPAVIGGCAPCSFTVSVYQDTAEVSKSILSLNLGSGAFTVLSLLELI